MPCWLRFTLSNVIRGDSDGADGQTEVLVEPDEESIQKLSRSNESHAMTDEIACNAFSDLNEIPIDETDDDDNLDICAPVIADSISLSDTVEQSNLRTENTAAQIRSLREHISTTECPWDLFNFASLVFDRIKLNDLQSLLFAEINEMNDKKIRILHFSALPINKVFCSDVMQHILSFGHCNHNRTVCQQWNHLNQQNEDKMLREMYNAVDDRNLPSLDSGGSIWVVHPKRPRLHPIEIRRGYRGPLKYLDPSQIPRGKHVRYLLHPGDYALSNGAGTRAHTQCIGLSPIHTHKCHIHISQFSPVDKHHLENVIVSWYSNQTSAGIDIVFKQCTIKITKFESIDVGKGGILDVTDCIIQSKSNELGAFCGGIRISSDAEWVSIKDSLFIKCLHCVSIMDQHKNRGAGGPPFPVEVVITNNRFHSTLEEHQHLALMLGKQHHPTLLLAREDERTERLKGQCTIHGNTSTRDRYRKLRYPTAEHDPNALYIKDDRGLASRNLFYDF